MTKNLLEALISIIPQVIDQDSVQSGSNMPPEEGNHDEGPNIILEVRREAVGSNTGQERVKIIE